MTETLIPSGWCCLWERCMGIGVTCVRVDGVRPGSIELCLPCAERHRAESVRIPETTDEETK